LGSQADDVEHLIRESEKKLGGPIDIVINNAGIQHVRHLAPRTTCLAYILMY
jgi:NAD(P)-dependent dehydrogenase (short-subunit alcohol dehydrogenase family)